MISKYRFDKAKDTLTDVNLLIENRLWNVAVNRTLLCLLYAVSALLANIDVFTKTHSGTRQLFGLHFIKEGKITIRSGTFYSELFDKRQKGDYEDFIDFEENDVILLLEPARNLISEIEHILYPKIIR